MALPRLSLLLAVALAVFALTASPSDARATRRALQPTNASATALLTTLDTVNAYPAVFFPQAQSGVGTSAAQARDGAVFSPVNIHHAIALLVAGARTPSVFLGPLYKNITAADYVAGLNLLLTSLQSTGANISLASSVWLKNINIPSAYNTTVTTQLLGKAQTVSDLSETEINAWVASATRGKITQIVDSSVRAQDGILASALYFQDQWATEFAAYTGTESGAAGNPFNFTTVPTAGNASRVVTCDGMYAREYYAYTRTAGRLAVRVPLLHGFDAYFVTPDAATAGPIVPAALAADPSTAYLYPALSFTPFTGNITAADMSGAVVTSLPATDVPTFAEMRLVLPAKVHLESGYDLLAQWRNATDGYRSLTQSFYFLEEADLFNVTVAVHKATLDMDQKGIEASAATVIGIGRTSAPAGVPPLVMFNRPFAVYLAHRATGAVIFSALHTVPTFAYSVLANTTLTPGPTGTQAPSSTGTGAAAGTGGASASPTPGKSAAVGRYDAVRGLLAGMLAVVLAVVVGL